MWKTAMVRTVGAVAFTGISIIWLPYSSRLYPYTISQPSSFQHLVIRDTSNGQEVDYFFGAQGTALTNVNIGAVRGSKPENPQTYLRTKDARHIRKGGTVKILGHNRRWTLANFNGLAGAWSVKTTAFAAGGWAWRVTVSYNAANRNKVPIMEKMVRTFKLKP